MATYKNDELIEELNGAVSKKGAIFRRKHFRNAKGKCIKKGKKELYKMVNPRDFTAKPQTGNELKNREVFQNAIYQTRDILAAAKPENNPTPEQLATLHSWQARFEAQLPGTRGNHPDPEAPFDNKTHKQKTYYQLNTFIRAIIYAQLKSNPTT